MIGAYYRLTKPRLVYGNVFSAIAGFLFASKLVFTPELLFATVFGVGLVIAAGCVVNNIIDRRIDALMARTKDRPLVTGAISVPAAALYALVLGLAGFMLLFLRVNAAAGAAALFGFMIYVVLYGAAKRLTRFHTLVGALSGAAPILTGYLAATGQLDAAAEILFLVMVIWQMPHFYAIAMYRKDEYAAAGIPLVPSIIGARNAKLAVISYIVVYMFAESSLVLCGYAGLVYLAAVLAAGAWWLLRAIRGFNTLDNAAWGRTVFLASLRALLVFCVAVSFAPVLP